VRKDQLLELASLGIRHKVREMERQLADMWKVFPDIFLGDSAPQLLRPEPRGGSSNGHWPAIEVSLDEPAPKAAAKRGRPKKSVSSSGIPIDLSAYQLIYDFVEQRPGSRLSEVAAALKVHPANIRGKLQRGIVRGFFKKKADGYHPATSPTKAT
jgi:hypothetical protein